MREHVLVLTVNQEKPKAKRKWRLTEKGRRWKRNLIEAAQVVAFVVGGYVTLVTLLLFGQ